jgi:hypothetical protein
MDDASDSSFLSYMRSCTPTLIVRRFGLQPGKISGSSLPESACFSLFPCAFRKNSFAPGGPPKVMYFFRHGISQSLSQAQTKFLFESDVAKYYSQ